MGWAPTSKNALSMFVIYDHPRDDPSGYVVRRWEIKPGEPEPVPLESRRAPELEHVRAMVPDGCIRMPRLADDDPCVLEVWT